MRHASTGRLPRALAVLLWLAGWPLPLLAGPAISLIIDDLGHRADVIDRVAALPSPVALSVLPHRPHGAETANAGRAAGHEVMVHLPMAAIGGELLGPGGLTAELDQEAFLGTLRAALATVPGAVGVNNHMGSSLTRDERPMRWLMRELGRRGLFFVDSRTTHETVAYRVAGEVGLPRAERQVFLDNVRDVAVIRERFATLIRRAIADGSALAIAHPHPETLQVLSEQLPLLADYGVELVTPSELISRRGIRALTLGPASR